MFIEKVNYIDLRIIVKHSKDATAYLRKFLHFICTWSPGLLFVLFNIEQDQIINVFIEKNKYKGLVMIVKWINMCFVDSLFVCAQ